MSACNKCNNCGTRKKTLEYVQVRRSGGGSYNRAPRSYSTTICVPCGHELLTYEQEGHRYVGANRYSISSLRYAMEGKR